MDNYLIIGANSPMVYDLIHYINRRPDSTLTLVVRDLFKFNNEFSDLNFKNVDVYACDLDSEDIYDILDKTNRVYRGMCYVAGRTNVTLVKFMKRVELDQVFEVNFYKPFFITQFLLNKKRLEKKSNVIYVSSISGTGRVAPGIASYSTSKAALNNLVNVLALENGVSGIKFNTVCPGVVDSNFNLDVNALKSNVEDPLQKRYPLGYGRPEDISNLIQYLLIDNTWINGQNIVVDGGFASS